MRPNSVSYLINYAVFNLDPTECDAKGQPVRSYNQTSGIDPSIESSEANPPRSELSR